MIGKWTSNRVWPSCSLAVVFWMSCHDASAGLVELSVVERQGVARVDEPVTFSVPLPKGALKSAGQVRLMRDGKEISAQFRATGLWRPDASIRWLLVDFQTDINAGESQAYTLEYGGGISAKARPAAAVRIEQGDGGYRVATGAAVFHISSEVFSLFQEVRLADGTVVVSKPDADQLRYGAELRGLKPTVTRAIPDAANKGRSHLIYVDCSPRAGLQDYTLRFTSSREYEVTDGEGNRVGRGVYLKDFDSTDGLISIPGDAWLPYAAPAPGDVYTFRTIPEGHTSASESVREATILERGPLRSVIRVKGSLGPATAPVLEYTARRCFAYGVKNANGEGSPPTYFQVHSANGAMHGNVFMTVERKQ